MVASVESKDGGGLCPAGVERETRQGRDKRWGGVARSPARHVAGDGAVWGGRNNSMTEHNKENENGIASNSRASGVDSEGNSGEAISGDLCGQAVARQRRGHRETGKAGAQRGVWVDPATQHLGAIAEHDPGAYAFGRV